MRMKTKDRTKGTKQSGIILTSYRNFINLIYLAITTGLIGRFFTMYSAEQNKFRNGVIAASFYKIKNVSGFLRKITRIIANQFENSMLTKGVRIFTSWLISRQIKFYGTFIFSFGTYSIISYILKRFFIDNVKIQYFDLIAGCVLVIVSIPMFFSSKSLCELLKKSVIMHSILIETLGITEESLNTTPSKLSEKYALPFLCGIISGLLTYLFGALIVMISIIAVIAISMIIMLPEIGILCVALLTPFFSHNAEYVYVINIFIIVTAISYLLKLIRGKRTMQFKLLDLMVLIFGLLVLFGGIVSSGGELSKTHAENLSLLIVCYFLIINMIKTKEWMFRCTATLISSAIFVSLIGLIIQLFSRFYIIDFSFSTRVVPFVISLFNNSEILSLLLVFALPYTISYFFSTKTTRAKFSVFLINIFILAAIISTGSPLVIYTLIATLFVFFVIYSKKSVFVFLIIPVAIPFATLILPDSILNIFKNVFNLSVPSTNATIQTLQGSLKMIWDNLFSGIGVGQSAFKNVFGLYAMPATESATGVPSLLLRIISELGIGAVLVFIFIVIMFYQKSFEHLKYPYDYRFKNLAICAIASLSGMLFAGLFYDIWADNGMFWLFFTLIALSRVYYNVGMDEKSKHIRVSRYDVGESSIELSRKIVL